MDVPASLLRMHLDYTRWASLLILDAAAKLTPEELAHDFDTADGTVLDTLAHIFAADRLWLRRATGVPSTSFMSDADRHLSVLRTEWPALLDRWTTWAAGLTDQQAMLQTGYTDLEGRPCTLPVWQLIFHMVNHGTHHRGQVAGFLRGLNHAPPHLDLIYYYRQP